MEFAQIILVAILVEAIWENCKMIWSKGKFSVNMIGALIVSILVCTLTGVDIFPLIGLNISIPFIGSILTGIISSRGANFIHELIKRLKGATTDGN